MGPAGVHGTGKASLAQSGEVTSPSLPRSRLPGLPARVRPGDPRSRAGPSCFRELEGGCPAARGPLDAMMAGEVCCAAQ